MIARHDLRRATGIPTSADRKQAQEMQAQQAKEQAMQKQLQQAALHLDLEEKAADINKTKSETELNNAKAVQIGSDIVAAHTLQGPEPDPDADRQALIDDAMREAGGPMLGAPQQQQPAMAGA